MHDYFEDLKQFVAATISQTEERLRADLGTVRQDTRSLREELRDGFAGVGDSVETLNQHLAERDAAVDDQITWLRGASKAHQQTLSLHGKRLGHLEDHRSSAPH
jgi:hypothetical protein